MTSAHDVGDRVQAAEAALRESEARLRRLLETTRAVPWEADATTWQFTYVGPQAVDLLGYPVERWYERDFWPDHIHPEDRERAIEFCLRHSHTSDAYEFDYRMISADGKIVWLHDIVSVVRAGREAKSLRGFLLDITERKRTEEEAGQLRERLAHVARLSTMGELAAGIAHEVNQPLTAIATYARACTRMIQRGAVQDEKVLRALDQIGDEALRAGSIIHHLKDLVRKRESKRQPCDINDLIRDVVQLASLDARLESIGLRLDLGERLPPSRVDAVQVQQVILNLIRNGVEAIKQLDSAPGYITVATATRDSELRVSVSDQGPGISADVEAALFQPFFSTKAGGMGMGLSISRSIITAHGGRLWFTPNAGPGTTFHFTLPIDRRA